MLTLSKYHKIEAEQDFDFAENDIPEGCKVLHRLHSDIRELTGNDLARLSDTSKINKQHIYPSSNNIQFFVDIKKVVLLRSPDEIVLAYRRGAMKEVHSLVPGYNTNMSEEEWLRKSEADGLYSDLTFFYTEWKKRANPENTLFIDYQDYVSSPQIVINNIEHFYGLSSTKKKIKTLKSRYSRRGPLSDILFKAKAKIKASVKRLLVVLGIKKEPNNK